ncbi:DUF2815 family protein [Anaeroselena agilis]|uniref:DUF2815 family protein n=1 Tax=Anaeroselena agilis TaxID=3063788 RepID=A0ABU3NV80_9FIRM|nr:DUF2815 family protein [Selenomonadales bacterium 4137-cl]
MAVKPQPTKLVTGKVRLSYAFLTAPKKNDAGEDVWSCQVLIPKSDTATIEKYKACIAAVKASPAAVGKWGGKVPGELKLPLRDGDASADEFPERKGCWFFNANAYEAPKLVDANLQPIMDASEIYSGIYGRVSVNFFAFNNSGNKGIGVGLNSVQKLKDGEPLGGVRSKPEEDFGDGFEDDDDFLD